MQHRIETPKPLSANGHGAWGWLFGRGVGAHVFTRTRFDLVESLCGRAVGNPRWLYGPKERKRCPACAAIVSRRRSQYVRAA